MNYTASQQRAIATIDRNLQIIAQIIACAGSGKTQVISRRIVNILEGSHFAGFDLFSPDPSSIMRRLNEGMDRVFSENVAPSG